MKSDTIKLPSSYSLPSHHPINGLIKNESEKTKMPAVIYFAADNCQNIFRMCDLFPSATRLPIQAPNQLKNVRNNVDSLEIIIT